MACKPIKVNLADWYNVLRPVELLDRDCVFVEATISEETVEVWTDHSHGRREIHQHP